MNPPVGLLVLVVSIYRPPYTTLNCSHTEILCDNNSNRVAAYKRTEVWNTTASQECRKYGGYELLRGSLIIIARFN